MKKEEDIENFLMDLLTNYELIGLADSYGLFHIDSDDVKTIVSKIMPEIKEFIKQNYTETKEKLN